jgi:2,5-diketo-D-gluconate reductase A
MRSHTSAVSTELAGGTLMPLLGFGMWQLQDADAYNGARAALNAGYRHIDTAFGYGNEERIGAAIRDSGIDRDQIFITTKCSPKRLGREAETREESLAALGVDAVDLWLLHWPPEPAGLSEDMWRAFIEAKQRGRARAIGVSNFSIAQIDALAEATGQRPAVNQIAWSPFLYDERVAEEHSRRGVVLEGYSPLNRSELDHPVLLEIAAAHGKTVAQVILRWHIERGFVVLPRSARRVRIEENFDIFDFELTERELTQLESIAR